MAQSNRGSVNKSFSNLAASRSGRDLEAAEFSATNLKIIKTDIAPTGESVQLVRPMADNSKTSADIVGELVNKYDYKRNELVNANDNDLTAIEQAFGSNLATKLLQTYDGSAIVTDTQQDLIGEQYLSEQIKRAHEYQKKNSVIDRYSHLLYEGDRNYQSNAKDDLKVYQSSNSLANLKPLQQSEFKLSQTKLQSQNASGTRLVNVGSGVNLQQSLSTNLKTPQQQPSRQASNSQLFSLQEQLRRLQEEKAALEQEQQEALAYQRQEQERLLAERAQHERLLQERFQQERAQQERLAQEQHQQQQDALRRQVEQLVQQRAAAAAVQQQQQQQQQAQAAAQAQINLQHSSSTTGNQSATNLKSVTIDAYNDPQFKALLDQITKPFNVPVENIQADAQWPSQDSLAHLADPIIIPAPDPIVLSAPDVIRMNESYANSNSQSQFRTEVTFYPKNLDQKFYTNFDTSQLNLNGVNRNY